ncbi:alpha/beta fold hydrolase [Brachybacterium tyrofermentans]|uniref:alpha/beta fold hydrolase n=1 Tax=Brachybacterium tyrofermentans TaxID=47848 RepID=UPI003FD31211
MTESIVLVHGPRTSSSQWDLQLPGLREAGYLVSAPDLPGHGVHRGEPFTLTEATATISRAVLTAAEATGPATVHLVGSSLGGMLAIHAAAALCAGGLDRADEARSAGAGAGAGAGAAARAGAGAQAGSLASLTVCGSAVQPTPTTARLYGLGITAMSGLPTLPGRRSPSGGSRLRRARSDPNPATGATLLHALALGRRGVGAYTRGGLSGPEAVTAAMTAVGTLDLREDLRRIDVPVTILSPRFDQLRWDERSFANAAPRGRVVALGYGNHLVNLVRPERFTQDLLRILAEARPAPGLPA